MAQLMEPELRNKRFATNNILQQWLCGSVGRAVASDTRGPWFEFSHQQKINFYWTFVYCQLCIEKTKIKKKRPGLVHFFKNILQQWCIKNDEIMNWPFICELFLIKKTIINNFGVRRSSVDYFCAYPRTAEFANPNLSIFPLLFVF